MSGIIGEKRVSFRLNYLPADRYFVIDDVMLRAGNGTTQIDHVVVSRYGIFVIETKNYHGAIYGNANAHDWTQYIGKLKNTLYNPILQNRAHINVLQKLLREYDDLPFISIIVFPKDTLLKIDAEKEHVITWNNLNRTIKRYRKERLGLSDVKNIKKKISDANIISMSERKKHVENLLFWQRHKSLSVSKGICPHCGYKLVVRKGEYGDFYGCSNYPKCKFTCRL